MKSAWLPINAFLVVATCAGPGVQCARAQGAPPDTVAPTVTYRFPAAGETVTRLTEIQVQFNESVTGVEAADLLVNSLPTTNVLAIGPDVYAFQFAQPATGVVQVAFSAGHGIQDLAAAPNPFAGDNWNYTLDTNIPPATLIISEFLAGNSGSGTNAIRDEDGDDSDWIEIHNTGTTVVSLDGWYLTDVTNNLTKWRFPNVSLAGGEFLIVFASDKNRTNAGGRLHANFQLSTGGEYLALVNPLRQVASEFYPSFPSQQTDVSYGRDNVNPDIVGYFVVPTPGAPNSISGAGFVPEVQFSHRSGTFVAPFQLTLSTTDPSAVIRYTTNDASVATNSLLYTNPISITSSMRIRARAFRTGLFTGPSRSEAYMLLAANVTDFSSDLPVVILHSFGNQNISAGAGAPDTPATFTLIEPDPLTGRAFLTNQPSVHTRAGINLRGSSTQGIPKRNLAVEYWDEANQDIEIETLGMPAESDWVLYPPNGFDHPLIHNSFIYEVSRQVGRYAPRTRFVELFYKIDSGGILLTNNFGVYILTEKIKVDNNRVDIPHLEPENTNAPSVTGGYQFLINSGRVDANEIAINVPPTGQQVIYQDPEGPDIRRPERRAQEMYITNYLIQMATVLRPNNPDFTNLVTGYHAYIDVDSWIDHHILNVLGRNVDAIRLSGYFFKDRNRKLEFGPIWDFDRSMGTGKPSEPDIGYRSYNPREWLNQAGGDRGTDFFRYATHQWWGRLFEDVDFWQRYIDRWQELRRTIFTAENLFAIIDQQVGEIREAQMRDQIRWGPPQTGANSTVPRSGRIAANGYTNDFDGTYDGEIVFLKRWLTDRMDFVDTNFLAAPQLSPAGGEVSSGALATITAPARPPGSVIYYTLDGTDPRLPGGGVAPGAFSNTMGAVTITITDNVGVFARAFNINHRNIINANCPFGGCPPVTTPWSGPVQDTFYLSLPPLRITELMYHPADPPSGTNDQDDFEYLEVKNIGSAPLSIHRFRLSGGVDFDFPNEELAAGESAVIVRNQAVFQSRYGAGPRILGVYTNDNLANDFDHLVLEGPVREPIHDFTYTDEWHPITDGFGFSLVVVNENAPLENWNGPSGWRPSSALGGSPGADDPAAPALPQVVINEVLSHTDPPPPTDTIELLNLSGTEADISGWFLTDDFDEPKKHRIPPGTMIAPNGFRLFDESHFNTGPDSFGLNSLGDAVYLFSADANGNLTGYFHGFDFGPAFNGATFGRYVTSQGEQFPPQSASTLGSPNAGPKVGPVVISEVNFHPVDLIYEPHVYDNQFDEYIELHNLSGESVALYHPDFTTNTWRLTDAVDFAFPAGVVLPPSGFLLVVSFDPNNTELAQTFRARNNVPADVPLYGPYVGTLDNSSDAIELRQPDRPEPPNPPAPITVPYPLVERVRYRDTTPWPIAADGIGPSLQRIVEAAYGNDPTNWQAAAKSPGASYVTGPIPVITQQPQSQTNIAYLNVMLSVVATSPTPLSYQWRFNGAPVRDATNSILLLENVQPAQAGAYDVVVLNPSGSIVSSSATLSLLIPARFVVQPLSQEVRLGTNVNFSVGVFSTAPPVQYQWLFNGQPIPGATGPAYSITNIGLEHGGDYMVVVTDGVSTTNSEVARLLILINPVIIVQPLNQEVPYGGTATFSVTVSNTVTFPIGYRWRRAGATVAFLALNEYTGILTVPDVTNTAPVAYTVVITNAANRTGVLSATAQLRAIDDTDSDGIPDAAEAELGLNANDPNDAAMDSDGDTLTNLEEYIAGTIHTDAQSYLKVDRISAPGTAVIEFSAVSNRTYTVQFTTISAPKSGQASAV